MFEIRLEAEDYPPLLRSIEDPPPLLWGLGDQAVLNQGTRIAIVGAREATDYGRGVAFELAKSLAQYGIVVVSGLALGIDTAAHEGALAGGGKTIAVLGCGLDVPYPKENLDLKRRVSESGAVVTEFPSGTGPLSWNFPRRNRIISGLSQAVLIVEAAEKSGALITAKWALAQGREVFAVPGNITSPQSAGTNRLIQSGAFPVLSAEDLLQTLKLSFAAPQGRGYNELTREGTLMALLVGGSKSIDEMMEETGMSVSEISSLLVDLEIRGSIRSLPGGRFERAHG